MALTVQTGKHYYADGSVGDRLRNAREGGLVVTPAGAPFAQNSIDGRTFTASMQAGSSIGTALTATAITCTLYNPAGSGVIISLLHVGVGITTAPASSSVATLVASYHGNILPITNTDLTIRSARVGRNATGGNSRVKAYSATTLPATPVVIRVIGSIQATGGTESTNLCDNVNGAITIEEGGNVTLQCIGGAVSGIVSMTWEEVES